MRINVSKFGALVAALLLLTAAVGAGAGAIAWDTETTSSTTTSDVDGTTTSIDVYHGDSTNSTYFEVDGATTSNLTLELTPSQAGVDYVAYENTTADTVNASAGHYAFNVSHNELTNAPRDVDGESYDVRIINQSSGEEVLNATGITFNNANADPKAVMVLTNDTTDDAAAQTPLVADRLEISSESPGFFSFSTLNVFNDTEDTTTVATWSGYTNVNGSNTTVEVHMDNSSSADAYSQAAEDVEDGEWMRESTVFLNGIPQKVYLNEEPSEDAPDTTVVYDASADKLVINMGGEDYENVRTLQMRGAAGESYGFGELWSNFGIQAAISSLV